MKPDFFNDNVQRAYPLESTDTPVFPEYAVADFGSIIFAGAGYREDEHRIWLDWIRRTSDTIEFCFRSDADRLQDLALIFQFNIADPPFTTAFAYAVLARSAEAVARVCACETPTYASDFYTEDPGPGIPDWVYVGAATTYQDGDGLHMLAADVTIGGTAYHDVAVTTDTRLQLTTSLAAFTGVGQSALLVRVTDTAETVELLSFTLRETGNEFAAFDTADLTEVRIHLSLLNSAYSPLHVVISQISLLECSTGNSSSSFYNPPPDPGICNDQSIWEGFMVVGELPRLLEYMGSCDQVTISTPASTICQVLILIDTSLAFGSNPELLTAIDETLVMLAQTFQQVNFLYSAAAYDNDATGGDYDVNGLFVGPDFGNLSDLETFFDGLNETGGSGNRGVTSLATLATAWELLDGDLSNPRLILWCGGSESNTTTPVSLFAAATALRRVGAPLYAINYDAAGAGIDTDDATTSFGQASYLCRKTGGLLLNVATPTATDISDFLTRAVLLQLAAAGHVEAIKAVLYGPGYVEPSRTQNLSEAHVRTVAVGNVERTRADNRSNCRPLCWPFELQDVYTVCSCLVGDIDFAEGNNVSIQVSGGTNAIIFHASVGSGLGPACDELRISPFEEAPDGRTTFTGSLRCSEVITQFNGNANRKLLMEGGDGVQITSIPAQHRIIVDVSLLDMAYAPSRDPDEAVICHYPSEDICECGPLSLDDFICPDPPPGRPTTTTTPAEETTTTPEGTTTTPEPSDNDTYTLVSLMGGQYQHSPSDPPQFAISSWHHNYGLVVERDYGLNIPTPAYVSGTPFDHQTMTGTRYDREGDNMLVGGDPDSPRVAERWFLVADSAETAGRFPTRLNSNSEPVFRGQYVNLPPDILTGYPPLTGMFQEVFLWGGSGHQLSFRVDALEGEWYWYLLKLNSRVRTVTDPYYYGNGWPIVATSTDPLVNPPLRFNRTCAMRRVPSTQPHLTYQAVRGSIAAADTTYTIDFADLNVPGNSIFPKPLPGYDWYPNIHSGSYLFGFGPSPDISSSGPPTARSIELRQISITR